MWLYQNIFPQFCIIFRTSLFSWLSFKTVIYFITVQSIKLFLFSATARSEDLGNNGEKSHAEPTKKRIPAILSCQEWLSRNLSGDPTGKLRKSAVTEPLHWPYRAQEHWHLFFCSSIYTPSATRSISETWVQPQNTSGLTKKPTDFSSVSYSTPSPGNRVRGHHRSLAQRQREVFVLNDISS